MSIDDNVIDLAAERILRRPSEFPPARSAAALGIPVSTNTYVPPGKVWVYLNGMPVSVINGVITPSNAAQ